LSRQAGRPENRARRSPRYGQATADSFDQDRVFRRANESRLAHGELATHHRVSHRRVRVSAICSRRPSRRRGEWLTPENGYRDKISDLGKAF
jgi:hypothetical protein